MTSPDANRFELIFFAEGEVSRSDPEPQEEDQ
jgi:hypothetical protein